MEKVCTEDIIKGLLALGYDRVDSILTTMIIGNLSLDQKIQFEEKDFSSLFERFVENDGFTHHLKKGYRLSTNISSDRGHPWTIEQEFSRNKELIKELDSINLQKIVDKKVKIIGEMNIKEYLEIFSNKERKLLPRIKRKENIDSIKRFK